MIRSLNTAKKAMQMEQVRIDALANNLANANSTGFRQILTRVSEAKAGNPGESGGRDLTSTQSSGSWPKLPDLNMNHALDTRTGPVKATGRKTDLAIMGQGYFVVSGADGDRYTRNGSFVLNEQRQLVTSAGQPVLGEGGPITLPGQDFSFEQDGSIMVDGSLAGRLRLVDFAEANRLEHEGQNLLVAPDGIEPQPVPPADVTISMGHLEGSNVNPIDTLVAMIAAQRAFEVHSKIMSTEDQMLGKAVNTLPRTSA